MPVSTVSSKGQLTLPVDIRRKLGIKPLDRVVVEATENFITIRPVRNFMDLKGFAGPAKPADEEYQDLLEAVAERQATCEQ